MATKPAWPNGKKIAVSVTVMFETWSENAAPNYSVQTTHLKAGTVDHASKAWSTYGGRVGVWRLIRMLDHLQIPGTFFTNGRCAEEYPDAVKQIVKSGHDIGGHAYVQDKLLAYMSLEDQQKTIRQSIDLLESCGGKKVTGWGSPVIAFTPETAGFLAQAGLKWTCDVTYADLPIRIHTPHGIIAGVPTTDFSDNRVMRASPRDLYDAYKGTFDYLSENEPMALTGAGHSLPVRRPAFDDGGGAGDLTLHRQVARCLVRAPRRACRLGPGFGRRRAQLSRPLFQRSVKRGQNHRSSTWMVSPGCICAVIGVLKR